MSLRHYFTDALGKNTADLLWTSSTLQVYPATPQGFSLGSLLPAVIYMFRRGFRRGAGRFFHEFSVGNRLPPNIFSVAGKLSQGNGFQGFDTETSKDILGDLLLCDALENKGGREGHEAEVQRAFPVHYCSSWLDLPKSVGHLRFVPEMLVAILADQPDVLSVKQSDSGEFTVGRSPQGNLLLNIFDRGVDYGNNAAVLAGNDADRIDETADFSIEEWLMVQLGRTCGQAPEHLTGVQGAGPSISANQPLTRRATRIFREDMTWFLRHYGSSIPRRGLTPMLESLIGLGLWHTFLASMNAVTHWDRTNKLPDLEQCPSFPAFADASGGAEVSLRAIAEASGFELQRFVNEFTTALATLRVMDAVARNNRHLKGHVPDVRRTAEWIAMLGEVREGSHAASGSVLDQVCEKCSQLMGALENEEGDSDVVEILRSPRTDSDPAGVLGEALAAAMGSKLLQVNYYKFLDSSAMSGEPHGMVRKRQVQSNEGGRRKRLDARSVVLSNTLLDALVHVHLAKKGGRMSYRDFVSALKADYGILIDEAPPGVAAERQDLLRNRDILEKRLRDLGLLSGVNDAESMKRLNARYSSAVSS